jgi:hypothetical protein
MGHFSMETYAPSGSDLSGNQQIAISMKNPSRYQKNCMLFLFFVSQNFSKRCVNWHAKFA